MTNRSVERHTPQEFPASMLESFFSPSLFQTLFWKPRFEVESQFAYHIPLLFWIVSVLQVRRAAVLGCDDGMAHFAICQAMDKLNIDGKCKGFGYWLEPKSRNAANTAPQALREHQDMLYKAQSKFSAHEKFDDVFATLARAPVDLLVVDMCALPDGFNISGDFLNSGVSEGGCIILHGNKKLAVRASESFGVSRFLGAHALIEFDSGSGLTVIFTGAELPNPIRTLVKSSSQGSLKNEVELVFRRCGEGLITSIESKLKSEKIRVAERNLSIAKKDISDIKEISDRVGESHQKKVEKISEMQSEIFSLREQVFLLETNISEVVLAQDSAAAQANQKISAAELSVQSMQTKVDKLEKENFNLRQERDAALQERNKEQQLRFEETAKLTDISEKLHQQISALQVEKEKILELHEVECEAQKEMQCGLKTKIETLNKRISELETSHTEAVNARDSAIDAHSVERRARFEETAALTRIAEEAERNYKHADRGAEILRQESDRLQKKIDRQAKSLEYMSQSVSWKTTAPLRELRKLIKKSR